MYVHCKVWVWQRSVPKEEEGAKLNIALWICKSNKSVFFFPRNWKWHPFSWTRSFLRWTGVSSNFFKNKKLTWKVSLSQKKLTRFNTVLCSTIRSLFIYRSGKSGSPKLGAFPHAKKLCGDFNAWDIEEEEEEEEKEESVHFYFLLFCCDSV